MKILIAFVFIFSFGVHAQEGTLLCVPEKEEYEYVGGFLKNTVIKDTSDLVVKINKYELIYESYIRTARFVRIKTNADPNLTSKFFMKYVWEENPKELAYWFS